MVCIHEQATAYYEGEEELPNIIFVDATVRLGQGGRGSRLFRERRRRGAKRESVEQAKAHHQGEEAECLRRMGRRRKH